MVRRYGSCVKEENVRAVSHQVSDQVICWGSTCGLVQEVVLCTVLNLHMRGG